MYKIELTTDPNIIFNNCDTTYNIDIFKQYNNLLLDLDKTIKHDKTINYIYNNSNKLYYIYNNQYLITLFNLDKNSYIYDIDSDNIDIKIKYDNIIAIFSSELQNINYLDKYTTNKIKILQNLNNILNLGGSIIITNDNYSQCYSIEFIYLVASLFETVYIV